MYFYTVQFWGRQKAEFDDFRIRMSATENDKKDLQEILKWIKLIGDDYGATEHYFRKEDDAEALPPKWHFFETDHPNDYGLRLYCIRLTPTIVILLNGDRKTAQNVRDCKNCYKHFDEAKKISKKITEAILINDIDLDIDNKEIIVYEDISI